MREAPSFSCKTEALLRRERRAVVNEGDVRAPRQLDEVRSPDRDPFTEVLRRHLAPLRNLAGFELHFADRRPAVQAGAFVEKSVGVLEALSECRAVVRIGADDSVRKSRR